MMYLATAVNDQSLIASVISAFTKGRGYHSELVFSNGRAISITGKAIGWVERDYDWYKWHLIPLTMINATEEKAMMETVDQFVLSNPKYDYIGAIFGKWFPYLQNKDKWYCSEYCRKLLLPYIPKLNEDTKWITPDRLMKIVGAHVSKYSSPARIRIY